MTPEEIDERYREAAVGDNEIGWDDPEEPDEDSDDDGNGDDDE